MTVGIDFGTSTSEIAYVDPSGNTIIIPNHLGEAITPSVVYFDESGDPIVGRQAKEMSVIEPENSVIEVKRLFGQEIFITARGNAYTPVDIAAIIIRYLVGCAEKFLGTKVDSAVITVPAYFTDVQRKDVMAAGTAAGLLVERIINEPTSASLDYGIRNLENCEYILVYDLGGGTLDVTVLELFEGVVDVRSSCGNNSLGGKDFDQMIIDHITGVIKKRDKVDITGDARAMMRLKSAAEQCKIVLSEEKVFSLELPFLYRKGDKPAGYSEKITRSSFEDMVREKIYSTGQQIKTALFDANLSIADINLTLLVGGSTRIPLVTQFLSEQFSFMPKTVIDPDLAVVRGAALQAGILSGVLDKDTIVLTDICPYSLSTGALMHNEYGFPDIYCDMLIKRNTTLPASQSKVYVTSFDYQTEVHVTAYQGESSDPDENYLLNSFLLSGIPKAKANKEKINVRFEYDLNGILTVSAEIVSTGKLAEVTVDTTALGKNLDLSKWKEAADSKNYRLIINKADRLINVYGTQAEAVESAANELKKGIVLGWEPEILDKFKRVLEAEINDFEEDNK